VVKKINHGKGKKATIVLKREGRIFHNQTHQRVNVEKAFTFCPDDSSIEVEYCIENCTEDEASLWFGVEFNLTLLAGEDEKRYYHYPCNGLGDRKMISQGTLKEVETFGIVDEWSGFKLTFSFDQPPDLWRFPIKTVSQSEDGFESTYQGSVIIPNWKLDLKKRCALKFKLQIEDI
ncbi:MAG: alpha-amylase/4-alpha-glucanotransferase domain-containing protein, partial [Thermodesulfobacteriota bacterium]